MRNIFRSLGRKPRKGRLTAQEAFAGILCAASQCDGDVAESEIHALITCMSRMELYETYDGVKCDSLINKAQQSMQADGVDEYLAQCVNALPKELFATAYINACNIVMADGVYVASEQRFLASLQVLLEVDEGTAAHFMDVIVVKNLG